MNQKPELLVLSVSSDSAQDIGNRLVRYRQKLVGDLEGDLACVVVGDHIGESVQRDRAGDGLREDHRIGGAQHRGGEARDVGAGLSCHARDAEF